MGWKPSEGNLCEVLPGKAIGGDPFGNREKLYLKDKSILRPMLIIIAETEMQTVLFYKNGDVYLTKIITKL